jgi:hypothetical protein
MNSTFQYLDQDRFCSSFVGFFYSQQASFSPTIINNIYLHFYWNSTLGTLIVAAYKDWRASATSANYMNFSWNYGNCVQNVTVSTADHIYSQYGLSISTQNVSIPVDENDVYKFLITCTAWTGVPSVISSKAYQSYIILNVPSDINDTFRDTDGDGYNDSYELYTLFSNPFIADVLNYVPDSMGTTSSISGNTNTVFYADWVVPPYGGNFTLITNNTGVADGVEEPWQEFSGYESNSNYTLASALNYTSTITCIKWKIYANNTGGYLNDTMPWQLLNLTHLILITDIGVDGTVGIGLEVTFRVHSESLSGLLNVSTFYWNATGAMESNGTLSFSESADWINFTRTLPDATCLTWYIENNDTDNNRACIEVQYLNYSLTTLTVGWNNFTVLNIDIGKTLGQVNVSLITDNINWTFIILEYSNDSTRWVFIYGFSYNTDVTIDHSTDTFYIYVTDADTWYHIYP